MKSFCAKLGMLILLLGPVLAVPAANAQVLQELRLIGAGTGEIGCALTITPGCIVWGWGSATGTLIVDGSFILRLDLGSPALQNGYPNTQEQGLCLPATLRGRLSAANGDTIDFNHVGIVCEEGMRGDPFLYNGTYRITGGTGQFASAAGGGSLAVTWTRATPTQPITVFFQLQGPIQF